MLQNLRRLIFGVPDDGTLAGHNATRLQALSEAPMYLPQSRLTAAQIEGVGDDGDVWEPWRVDAVGQQWYRRISASIHGDNPAPEIQAFDADPTGDAPEFDDVSADDADNALERYHRETAIIRARHARGEIVRDDSGNWIETNEFGEFDEYEAGDADDDDLV